MYVLKVKSRSREELVEFTDQVQEQLNESGQREGVVVLYVQHTTAGLTINENADPDVPRDMLHALRTLIPQHGMDFRHGEENSDAHIKASLTGSSVTIPSRASDSFSFSLTRSVNSTSSSRCRDLTFRTYIVDTRSLRSLV